MSPRVALPYVPRGMLLSGMNADVLKYAAIMSSVLEKSRLRSSAVMPGTSAAYCDPTFSVPFCATSVPVVNTSGLPDWKRWNPVSVQLFNSALVTALEKLGCGLHTHDAATTCRRSRMDGPHSDSRSKGLGMLLMSPVVFSGWFVRFLDNAYDAENEN